MKDAALGDDIRKIAARYVANPAQIVNKLKIDAPNQVDLMFASPKYSAAC